MKKVISLQVLMLMGLALGSSYSMQAYDGVNKYAHDKKHESKNEQSAFASDKQEMKSIERQLDKIRRQFDKNHDKSAAEKELKSVERKIKKVTAEMRKDEHRGAMWKVHEHTLQRKVKEVRKHIENRK